MSEAMVRFQVYQAGRLIGTYQVSADKFDAVKREYESWGLTVVVIERTRAYTYMVFSVAPSSGLRPLTVTAEGALYDAAGNPLEGKPIDIYANDIRRKSVTTGYAGYAGYFTTKDTLEATGDFNYQARFAGDATYEGCIKDAPTPVTVTEIPVAVVPPAPAVPAGAGLLLILALLLMAK